MKIDSMRRIDFWAGVPLCALLTLLMRLLRFLRGTAPEAPAARRVLFIELSEMGSAILADPAMRKTRQAGCEIFFLIFASNAASLRLLATVAPANIFVLRADNLFTLGLDTLRFLLWSRRVRIDTVIDLELFSRITALLTALSGAARRVGFYRFHNEGLYRGEMLTHRVAYNPHIHIAANFLSLVQAALAPVQQLPFSKVAFSAADLRLAQTPISAAEQAQIRARVQTLVPDHDLGSAKLILINPNASDLLPQRRWMAANYLELIRLILAAEPAALVLLTGSKSEHAAMQRFKDESNDGRCINFAGQVTLDELPTLYSLSHLLVSNESGPGHFSAVTALRAYVLFGPETPTLYGSLGNSVSLTAGLACSPCVSAANHRKSPCHENLCLSSLTPQWVFEQLRADLLAAKPQQTAPSIRTPAATLLAA